MPYASGSHKWKYQMVSARSVRVIGVSFCSGIPRVASCNISNACMHQNLIRSRMILIAPHLNLSGLVFARRFWNKGSPAWIETFSRKPSDQASVLLKKMPLRRNCPYKMHCKPHFFLQKEYGTMNILSTKSFWFLDQSLSKNFASLQKDSVLFTESVCRFAPETYRLTTKVICTILKTPYCTAILVQS